MKTRWNNIFNRFAAVLADGWLRLAGRPWGLAGAGHRQRLACAVAVAVLAGSLFSGGAAQAGQINFSSTANSVNLTSAGALLTGQFVFELGVFDAGFTPTAANAASWASKWHRAKVAFYNPKTRYMASSYAVTSNAAPFALGTRGYIWAHDGSCAGGESLLLTDPSWGWPSTSALDIPVSWTVATASSAIVGQINQPGFHMKTAALAVTLPTLTYADWRAGAFTAGQLADSTVSGPSADPDGDGQSNLMEFALGGVPTLPDLLWSRVQVGTATVSGSRHLTLSVLRRCDRLCNYTAEATTDLKAGSWTTAPVQIVENTADRITFAELLISPSVRVAALRAVFTVP